ncbi:hypothetical protein [Brevundimonas olei]|uniref:hypothetical protein n=1 Tax=Brevundimonas olei TaxID=657642 RepID=UPI0031E43780
MTRLRTHDGRWYDDEQIDPKTGRAPELIHPALVEAVMTSSAGPFIVDTEATTIVNAVLDRLIELTPSPRTVDELTRVRGEGA